MSETEQIKAALLRKTPPASPVPNADLLSTGCTALNLALTGRPQGGMAKGHYYWFVGDSSSGKTFFALTLFAEAAHTPRFKDYRFIYNKPEEGALMDMAAFFGQGMADRVEMCKSRTVDQFFYECSEELDKGPCIYVLDSADALSSDQEKKKFKERKAAFKKGPTAYAKQSGEMTDGKAKKYSSGIRQLLEAIQAHRSIMLVISQTRDNMDNPYDPKTASGGRALKFYATTEIWTSVARKLKKTVRDQELQIGIEVRAQVKKNRLTGKEWAVEVPLYWSYGIDDIGGCVDFLVKWKGWPKNADSGIINATHIDLTGKRETLIRQIEKGGLEKQVRMAVAEVWAEIEEATTLQRVPRYS